MGLSPGAPAAPVDQPRLIPGTSFQLDRVYRESHELWGAGLSWLDYRGLWDDLLSTAWGARHARFLVWGDRDSVLSSLKLYRPAIRVGERLGRAAVIGAVFTPHERRSRGHARAAVEAAVAAAARRGDLIAMLFTDIGTSFYERLGFEPLPAFEYRGRLPSAPPSADLRLEDVGEADLAVLRAAHEAGSASRSVRMLRDAAHWSFIELRARRFFERLGNPSLRARWLLARDAAGRRIGYIATVESETEWVVREVGALDGSPRTAARIVDASACAARAAGLRQGSGWLPPEVAAELAAWAPRRRRRTRAVPMLRSLDSERLPTFSAEGGFVPFHDQF